MERVGKRALSRRLLPVLLLVTMPIGVRAEAADQCRPSPEIQSALDTLPLRSVSQTEWEFRQTWLNAIQKSLDRFPDDVFLQRAFIRFARPAPGYAVVSRPEWDEVRAQFSARYQQHPNDARLAYLYALTLEGRRSPEAIKLLESALAEAPGFPWPHLLLVTIYTSPNFRNKAQAAAHLKAFLEACPASIDGYQPLTRFDDTALIASNAARLRALIDKRTDAEAVGAYPTLWSLEFKTHSTSEHNAVRKQVAEDLERIRSLKLEDKRRWYDALRNGYKLVNDRERADWATAEEERRLPWPWQLAAASKWFNDHPLNPGDPPGKKREFYSGLLKQTRAWIEARPNAIDFWRERFDALAHLDDTPPADLEAAADRLLKFAEYDAGPRGARYFYYFEVAEALSKRHLKPELTVQVAKRGLAQWEMAEPLSDLNAIEEEVAEFNFYRACDWMRGTALAVSGYLDLKHLEEAQRELVHMDERLQTLKGLAADKPEYKKEYSSQLARWWDLMARAAVLQNHQLDAVAFYQGALTARLDAQQRPEIGVKDELAESARQLWTRLGGTGEGWQMLYGRRAGALASQTTVTWDETNDPLPAFELTDLKGKTWNLASLKGKVTFLNFWASW